MADTVGRATVRKVYWRRLPLAILTSFLCYRDRINVGFAALTMNKNLGLDVRQPVVEQPELAAVPAE